jgi:hypothetical protein
MAHPISHVGIVHTAISLIPVFAALYSFARYRTIDPKTGAGRVYIIGLVLSVFTSFGLSSTGRFNAGHALGILALLVVLGSLLSARWAWWGSTRPYLVTFGFSFSFFLTLIPGISETLTRLPPAQPFAGSAESPLVRFSLLAWFIVFIVGFALQAGSIRSSLKTGA